MRYRAKIRKIINNLGVDCPILLTFLHFDHVTLDVKVNGSNVKVTA